MANVYCDNDLASGSNNGTDWANAYQSLVTAATNAAAGDIVYVKDDEAVAGTYTLNFANGTPTNPVVVLGCKPATTNEPPVQSDLIPGWRTGDARTEANLACKDADIPTVGSSDSFTFVYGYVHIYAVAFTSAATGLFFYSQDQRLVLEECLIDPTGADVRIWGNTKVSEVVWKNCEVVFDATSQQISTANNGSPMFTMEGGLFSGSVPVELFDGAQGGIIRFRGVNMSSLSGVLVDLTQMGSAGHYRFENCSLHASATLVTGTAQEGGFIVEAIGCSSVTGKSSGSEQNYQRVDVNGSIVEETTAVRTGGATDGEGAYSLAYTPNANGTRDQYLSLIGPWMQAWVEGDGTSSTLTCYIANSGVGDYNNDDVYLEVFYPSEGGTAQHTYNTNQMELLDTPAAVTDDTDSTWGTGGNNPQKLQVSIAPDYSGLIMARVHFAKNFSSSPETLYVDPELEVA